MQLKSVLSVNLVYGSLKGMPWLCTSKLTKQPGIAFVKDSVSSQGSTAQNGLVYLPLALSDGSLP